MKQGGRWRFLPVADLSVMPHSGASSPSTPVSRHLFPSALLSMLAGGGESRATVVSLRVGHDLCTVFGTVGCYASQTSTAAMVTIAR